MQPAEAEHAVQDKEVHQERARVDELQSLSHVLGIDVAPEELPGDVAARSNGRDLEVAVPQPCDDDPVHRNPQNPAAEISQQFGLAVEACVDEGTVEGVPDTGNESDHASALLIVERVGGASSCRPQPSAR